jgi:hypothetical protein
VLPRRLTAILILALVISTSIPVSPVNAASVQSILASHWVQGWGFRDELNRNDIDYQNFWTDNAGKILASSILTNDLNDANLSLWYIQKHMTQSYYLPELLVNGSILRHLSSDGSPSFTNGIALLNADASLRELQQLSIGDYYAGAWTAGYLGSDAIWYNGALHRAVNATWTASPDGFIKRAYFYFDGLSFYTYLNATITVGDPYSRVSVQVQPLNSTFGAGVHAYLQVFAGAKENLQQYAFENATLFDLNGNPLGQVPFDHGAPQGHGGMVVAYSNRTSILDQDAVALRFNATGIRGVEHRHHDSAFDGLSWLGLQYDFPVIGRGQLSAPVFAEVYPIRHLDSRLLSDTAKYIASNPKDVAVSPPVGFGFVARGLALASNLNLTNSQTLRRLATGYWNFYFGRYQGMLPNRAYARVINVFALAGFELYPDGNATVEKFTREFVGKFSGTSIEERGWAAAALKTLLLYTKSQLDMQLLQNVTGSFVPGGNHFVRLTDSSTVWNDTFSFAEAAAGLLSGGSPYNNSVVLWAMNAVFQSNSSGILLIRPFKGDLANTETIPAYSLAVRMFTDAMRSRTDGYWIDLVQRANITAISYDGGQLKIQVVGDNGTVVMHTPGGPIVCPGINGMAVLPCSSSSTPWVLLVVSLAVVAAISSGAWYLIRRKSGPNRAEAKS